MIKETSMQKLAYATERLNSAIAWSSYFGQQGTKFKINPESLHQSCVRKQQEAQERVRYIQILSSLPLEGIIEELSDAKEEEKRGNYIFCLFKASKAKAETDTVMGVFGVKLESMSEIIDTRLELANDVILKQQQQELFPILGYSYYEYAKNLQEEDPSSSLVYAHYALEFSNLDMYFEKDIDEAIFVELANYSKDALIPFAIGFIAGTLAVIIIVFIWPKGKKSKIKRK